MSKIHWILVAGLCLFLPARALKSAVFYTTYSVYECGQNTGFRHGFVHLYSIKNTTDCYLNTITTSSPITPTDIATGPSYNSLGMVDGQPFDPPIVDPPGPSFGNHYFMLKSTYPMIWELGSDITSNAVDRDCFIISDNATYRGTRFFTHLDWEQGTLPAADLDPWGDLITVWNPNTYAVNATVSRWTGVAGNYTPLVTQNIGPGGIWTTGGTMPWEITGAQGTASIHATHYRVTADNDVLVSRGNFYDSDNDNAWTVGPDWNTGLKVGTELYGWCTNLGPSLNIVVTDASGAPNSYKVYFYTPAGLAPVGHYMLGSAASGTWTLATTRPVGAWATDAYANGAGATAFKVVANAPVQLQIGLRIASNNTASNADWFPGITGLNSPWDNDFRFRMGDGNWVSVIAPTAGTAVTLRNMTGFLQINGRGSNQVGPMPLQVMAAAAVDTQTTTVPNQAITWRLASGNPPAQYHVTSTNDVYTFAGAIGGEKYYSAPVPQAVFSQVNMVKSVSKSQAYPNDILTYTINWTNAGNTTLTGVNLWDPIPGNSTYVAGSATSNPAAATTTFNGTQVNWYFPTMLTGTTGTVSFQVQIAAGAPIGSYINNTSYAQDDGTFMPAPGNSNLAKTLIIKPLVSVVKSNNPTGAVSVGSTITYTLDYQNNGTTNATGVYVCDTIPAGTTLVPLSETSAPPFTYTVSGNLLCWNIPSLPAQFTAAVVTLTAGTVQTSTGIASPASAQACDGAGAGVTGNTSGSEVVSVNSFAFPAGAVITSVVINAKWWSVKYFHTLGLNFSTDGSNPTLPSNVFGATTAASPGAYSSMDITSLRAWTPALVNNLRMFFSFAPIGSPNNQEVANLDCISARVDYTVPSGAVYSGTLSFQVLAATCNSNLSNLARESDNQSPGSFSNTVLNTIPGCTPSATFTATKTYTSTPTATPTVTFTPSPTRTSSPTPSRTFTPSLTFTPTSTLTHTPTATRTATQTVTFTPSATYTATPTATPTFTRTVTFTPSATLTATPTFTLTATRTVTFTPSATYTATPTSTLTATQTVTFTPSTTFTFTPSVTPTATQTVTFTPSTTFTHTPTQTLTATQTITFSPSPTFTSSPTVSFSSTQTDTFSPTPTPSGTPSQTVTSSATLTSTPTASRTATGTQTPSLTPTMQSATPSRTPSGTVTLSSTPTLTFTGTFTVTQSATVTATYTPQAPFLADIKVYNSAGEVVVLLAQNLSCYVQPQGLKSLVGNFVPDAGGLGSVSLLGPGLVINWDGKSSGGQFVSSGAYVVEALISDSFGHVTTFTTTLNVVRQDRAIHVEIYNSAGELVRHFEVPSAPAGSSGVSLSDTNLATGETLLIHYGAGPADYVSWDGTGDQGTQVQSGAYLVKVTRHTGKGQTEVFTSSVTVIQTGDPGTLAQVRIWPNPAPAGGLLTISLAGAANARVLAQIYTLAGEQVASLDNGGAQANLYWDTGKHAPGIYFIRLTLQDSMGRMGTRLMKVSLL